MIITVPDKATLRKYNPSPARIAHDVYAGLSKRQKAISSRYFYDAEGSALFEKIMHVPEYYPTRCEEDILKKQSGKIVSYMLEQEFDLIDLGSGNGLKTMHLLRAAAKVGVPLRYYPVDISETALDEQANSVHKKIDSVEVHPLVSDYVSALQHLKAEGVSRPKLVLLLGGNLGNYQHREILSLLRNIWQTLKKGDKILIGFDLQKDPRLIQAAYSDASGVTAEFNLNLLKRFNREIGANFKIDAFRHYATYDPVEGVARSFLISEATQTVTIGLSGKRINFLKGEAIHTENSYKFHPWQIDELAYKTGFRVMEILYDSKRFFADSIWEKP